MIYVYFSCFFLSVPADDSLGHHVFPLFLRQITYYLPQCIYSLLVIRTYHLSNIFLIPFVFLLEQLLHIFSITIHFLLQFSIALDLFLRHESLRAESIYCWLGNSSDSPYQYIHIQLSIIVIVLLNLNASTSLGLSMLLRRIAPIGSWLPIWATRHHSLLILECLSYRKAYYIVMHLFLHLF